MREREDLRKCPGRSPLASSPFSHCLYQVPPPEGAQPEAVQWDKWCSIPGKGASRHLSRKPETRKSPSLRFNEESFGRPGGANPINTVTAHFSVSSDRMIAFGIGGRSSSFTSKALINIKSKNNVLTSYHWLVGFASWAVFLIGATFRSLHWVWFFWQSDSNPGLLGKKFNRFF